jgi:hypothetical protein
MPRSAQQRRAIEGRGAAILPDTGGLEMNDAILAALFLNFAGATSLNSMLSGHRGRSTFANKLFRLAMIGGTIALLLALFLFMKHQGIHGIIYWAGSGLAFSLIAVFFLTGSRGGLRSVLGLVALVLGGYFASRALQ